MAITKVDIWNTFRVRSGYRRTPYVEAKAMMGESAIRYWRKKGWIAEGRNGDVYYVELTEAGRAHIERGVQKHLENHPTDRGELRYFPKRLEVPLVTVEYVE